MKIKLFITGGTIDCEKIEDRDKYIFKKTHLPEMLEQAKCKVDIDSQVLMMKDSIYMSDEDRKEILQGCENAILPRKKKKNNSRNRYNGRNCTGFGEEYKK